MVVFVNKHSRNDKNQLGSENDKRWLGWKWITIWIFKTVHGLPFFKRIIQV